MISHGQNGLRASLTACSAVLAACTPLSGLQRPAASSLSCAKAAVATDVPGQISDKRAHCMAAAAIARRCSTAEAYGASVAKEIADLFGRGDAEWGDLRADAKGIRCARAEAGGDAIEHCCDAFSAQGVPDASPEPL